MSEKCGVQHQDGVVDRCVRCRCQQASLEDVARHEAEEDDTARGTAVSLVDTLPFCVILVIVSKLGCIHLFFVELCIKVDGRCYWEVLLKQQMLPVMCCPAGSRYMCSSRTGQRSHSSSSRHCSAAAARHTAVHRT